MRAFRRASGPVVRLYHSARAVKPVEMRSDTFTKPSEGMRRAMYMADVGDDCYNEDRTVHRLEAAVAGLLGKEAGMFCASGTMSNLLGLAAHCNRGDEIILGNRNHVFQYEGGGASCLLGVAYHTVPTKEDGTNDLQDIRDAIRPDDFHFPRTRLVAVETTHNKAFGTPLPQTFMDQVGALCRENSLIFHVDGARLMNAAVALDTPAAELCRAADSISLCLSKGLGAPVGSVLVGTKDVIKEAKRQRKVLGGGWRQGGILAAAGLYALENNVMRLAEDHANAQALALGLSQIPGLKCDPSRCRSNLVYFEVEEGVDGEALVRELRDEFNVWIGGAYKGKTIRAVTNLMVNRADIDYTLDSMRQMLGSLGSRAYFLTLLIAVMSGIAMGRRLARQGLSARFPIQRACAFQVIPPVARTMTRRQIRTSSRRPPFSEYFSQLFASVDEEVNPGKVEGTDLQIVVYPDPRLRAPNALFEEFGPEVQKLAKDMFKVMYAANGVGLAAPQVGVNKRLMVFNPEGEAVKWLAEMVLVNPVIVEKSTKTDVMEEGCLSFPGMGGEVERSVWIKVEYQDVRGKKKTKKFKDWEARIFQHEYDHLDGVLYVDRLTPEGRTEVQGVLDKLVTDFGPGGAL